MLHYLSLHQAGRWFQEASLFSSVNKNSCIIEFKKINYSLCLGVLLAKNQSHQVTKSQSCNVKIDITCIIQPKVIELTLSHEYRPIQ
jgi:hypothetical protein